MYNHRLIFPYQIKVQEELKNIFNSKFLVDNLYFQRWRKKSLYT